MKDARFHPCTRARGQGAVLVGEPQQPWWTADPAEFSA